MAGDQTFENLSHSGLIKIPSKENKEVSFQIDVWGGSTSFVVFTGAGGRPWKTPISPKGKWLMKRVLEKMRDNPEPQRQPVNLNTWDPENKKVKQVGCIGFGIDEKQNFFIDIAHSDLQGRHQFFVRSDLKIDVSQTNLTERDNLAALFDYFIDVLVNQTATAERLTAFKRAPGGNRGGGGGNFGGGGNRGGGGGFGGNNNNNGGTFGGGNSGGGSASKDDLDF